MHVRAHILLPALLLAAQVHAQDTPRAQFLQSDWLKAADEQQRQAASGETIKTTTGPVVTDPFVVLSTGVLLQDTSGVVYTRRVGDTLSITSETNTSSMANDAQLTRNQKAGFQFQPADAFIFRGDVHSSATEAFIPADSISTTGANISAETLLPTRSVLTLGMRTDRTIGDVPSGLESRTDAYDAQFKQPIGQLPLAAIFKGHLEGTAEGRAPTTSLPSLEQSLQWKPHEDTTIQMGLRQQQYQEYPGVDHQLNEALFADWSQRLAGDVSWHSYAEVLNSRGLFDQAPASPIASGANGTAQATTPGSNASPTSSLPVSIDNQTLTFSTGPSFKLQKDLSASLEYSNRWDKNPAPGNVGQEQRVSVSVKGSF